MQGRRSPSFLETKKKPAVTVVRGPPSRRLNNPGSCVSDKAKVGYLINHLTDKALLWATPLWENKKPIIYDYEGFTSELKRTFDPSRRGWQG
uniref:DUF4939 domain-containing protein n=1 Tax=Leptobrachium leishanense TaxID=445787 RepID=A0A8C5R7N6_9ANUR